MTVSDDHESLLRLKHRIERHNQREREAIARDRAEWEKWLKEKAGSRISPDMAGTCWRIVCEPSDCCG